MHKSSLRIVLVVALTLGLWTACSPALPEDIHVDILPLSDKETSLNELQAAFAGNALTPPLYQQSPGTKLYGAVIPFDVRRLPDGVNYNIVTVMVNIVKDDGTGGYAENQDVKVVTVIPFDVEHITDKTQASKTAASITGTLQMLTGTIGVEQSTSETYQKIYRSVTAHFTPQNEISWEFTPFLDEPVEPGTYYVVAVLEVPVGSTGNVLIVSGGCSYGSSSVVSGTSTACSAGEQQKFSLP
ncbi:MAG TPA: hypothetical protein VMT91_01590 [Anaerolineales bacterium]|nr:hypothetical protein [Anaerolineales bacterium]